MTQFYVHRAAADYITITSWNRDVFEKLKDWLTLVDDPEKCDPASVMWYSGTRCNWTNGSAFYGEGTNQDRQHFLIQISGMAADGAAFALAHKSTDYWKVSRIDFQITIPLPEWYKSRAFVDSLRNDVWPWRSRTVTLVDGNGDDTVYIGSRQSERFIRVYVKDADYLRFEVEFKGKLAEKAFERYSGAPTIAAAGIIAGELVKLPKHPVQREFREVISLANTIDIQNAKPVTTPSKTFKWFTKQVLPALKKLVNDHDVGDRTRAILLELITEE